MNLRWTTLLIVAITFAGLMLVLTVTTREVLANHFESMETQSVSLSLARTARLIESEYDQMARVSADWVQRDAVDEFLQLESGYFADIDVSLVIVFDEEGNVVEARVFSADPLGTTSETLKDALLPHLNPENLQSPARGILPFQGQPMLVVVQPVSSGGMLLVGRLLDGEELSRLSGILQLPLTFVPYGNPGSGVNLAAYYALLEGEENFVYALDDARIAGYTRLETPAGQPAYLLRIEQARQFFLSGQRVQALISVALVTAGAVFAIMTVLFLELMVFSRLTRLSREVNAIRPGELPSKRVTISQHDELSQLGKNINAMLDSLEQAQQRRLEAQDELRSRIADLLALNDSSVQLITRLDAPNTLDKVCRLAVEQFGVEMAWIGRWSADHTRLRPVASHGCPPDELPEHFLTDDPDRPNPAFQAMNTYKMVVQQSSAECGDLLVQAQAAFPLPLDLQEFFVLNLYSVQTEFFTANRLRVLEAFANLAGIALQNASLFTQVQEGRRRQEALSRRLVELQEEERRAIARELHDEIGQILTGLNLMLGADFSTYTPEQRKRLENAHKLVNELIGRVRQMSLTLRPGMLDDLGLLPTLLWHLENYTRQTGIRVDFHHNNLEGRRFLPEVETTVYRVVQEALTNVARHAGVEEAQVQIWVTPQDINVQIEDRGAGFDPRHVNQEGNTFGLLGMQERAVLLLGNLTIDTRPGHGTSLYMQIPLAQAAPERVEKEDQ